MKTKRFSKWSKVWAVLLAAVLAFGLSGCGAGTGSGSSGKKTKDGLTEVDVVLDWYPNAVHSFLYWAQEKGYFRKEGLKVKIISPAESVDAINFVASGKAQVGISYPIDTINAVVNKHMPVKAIGAVTQKQMVVMISLQSNSITKDFKTLKGKKIGYDGTNDSKVQIQAAASYAGLKPEDYELVDVGFDLTTALTSKKVDIVGGPMINDEVITLRNKGYKINVFPYTDYGVPECYGLVLDVNSEAYEKDPEMYKGFLRACRKGFRDMKSDENGTLDLIMKRMSSDSNPLNRKQQKGSYETLLPYMETKDGNFLTMNDATWNAFIKWMRQQGVTKELCKPSDVMIKPDFR